MNTYLTSVIENVKKKHGNEPEFVQTVEEVFSSLEPVIEKHPEYEKVDLLNRMVEPERMFTFRVSWMADDQGQWHTNIGLPVPVQRRASGPTRAACGSRPTCIRGIIKFLGFEQTFKNSLTGLPIGGGKGGSDFDPGGEVGRGDHAVLPGVHDRRCTGTSGRTWTCRPGTWAWAAREIGYLFGEYRRLKGRLGERCADRQGLLPTAGQPDPA